MAFKAKNEQLLGETYRNFDELSKLGLAERSLSIKIARATEERAMVRQRRHELRKRNEEIDWLLRRDTLKGVTLPDWRNQIRNYQAAA